MSVLDIINVSAGYGDVDVIKNIDINVHECEIVTIAGTNGSGKSTILKCVIGLLKARQGAINVKDVDISNASVENRVRSGISYVPQVQNVFPSLTVQENLQAVRITGDYRAKIDVSYAMFPDLAGRSKVLAGRLSGGERQQLAFARALMSDPHLVLLDEPSAALAPALVELVFEEVKKLPKAGVAVLMVEQRARQALALSDRGYILDNGRIVMSDRADVLLASAEMAELYLGDIH